MSIQISWRASTPGKSHRLTFKRGAVGICAALETFLDPDNVNGPAPGADQVPAKEGFPCHQDQIPDRVEFGPPKALIASLINPQGRYKLDPEWVLRAIWVNFTDHTIGHDRVDLDLYLYLDVRRLIKAAMPRQMPAGTVRDSGSVTFSVKDLVGEVS